MNKKFDYKSVLAPFINDFIALKEAAGLMLCAINGFYWRSTVFIAAKTSGKQ